MAEKEQGTGQHKHKSSEEPYPHHEAPTTRGSGSSQHSSGSQSSQHSSGSQSGSSSGSQSGSSSGGQSGRSSGSSQHSSGSESSRRESSGRNESGDMKNREYTDSSGQVHHHTKKYEEEHKR